MSRRARAASSRRERAVGHAARIPRLHAVLRAAARRRAGRVHVAVVGVLLSDGRVLVASHAFRAGRWSLPGGWMHRREDPRRALQRELREEIGGDVEVLEAVGCERQGEPAAALPYDAVTIAFRCARRGDAAAPLRLSAELADARWCTVEDAARLLSPFERGALDQAVRVASAC